MKNYKNTLYILALLLATFSTLFYSCSDELEKADYDYQANKALTLSTLKFDSIVKVTDESISLYATLTNAGQSEIYDQGFIYSLDESFKSYSTLSVSPDTIDNVVKFIKDKYKLAQGKSFYFKAFVLTKDGLAVSAEVKSVNLPITWEDAGTVHYVDGFWTSGAEVDITIQKFYGQNRYRLLNLFHDLDIASGLSEAQSVTTGKHLEFTLDDKWNAVSLPTGNQDVFVDPYLLYYNASTYSKYCYFTNSANVYTIGYLCKVSGVVKYSGTGSFTWTTGYPGVIPEPIVPVDATYKTDFSNAAGRTGWVLDKYSGTGETDNVFFYNMADAGAASWGNAIVASYGTETLKIISPSFSITSATDTLTFGYYSGLFGSTVNAKVKVYIRVAGESLDLNNPIKNWDLAKGVGSTAIPLKDYAGKSIKVILMVDQGDFLFYHFAIAQTSDQSRIF
jgi:hypothetical protein